MQPRNDAPGDFQVSLPGERDIVIIRTFAAPRALVFEAWTRPEHVSRWWDPGGLPLQACEIDLRAGGRFRWVNRGHAFTGTYDEISPPHRLVMRVEMGPGKTATSTLEFTEQDGRTALVMTMRCASREDRDLLLAMRVDQGTGASLANLDRHLQAGGRA